MSLPSTRPSLIVRIRDAGDQEAWNDFSQIYRPVIVRLAIAKGMQRADADDLAQAVLIRIADAIDRWRPAPSHEASQQTQDQAHPQAKFRTWLRRIAENAIISALTRAKPDQGVGGSLAQPILENFSAGMNTDSEMLRTEYRREVFQWAAKQVRHEFSAGTWEAFWITAVDQISVDDAMRRTGKTRGAIYAARSRVMRRLTEVVALLESEDDQ